MFRLSPLIVLYITLWTWLPLGPAFAETGKLPVGLVIPLTGEISFVGIALQQGISLALAEGKAPNVTFHYEDDRSTDRTATVRGIRALLQRYRIRVAVVTGMPNLSAANALLKTEGVVGISAADSNREIERLTSVSFGYGWSNESVGTKMAKFACSKLRARTAAVVTAQDEWSETIGKAFEDTFAACGGSYSVYDEVELTATDHRSMVTRIVRQKPDAVYFPLYGPSLLSFAKQLRQGGFQGTLLTAEGMTEVELRDLGPLGEGVFVTTAHLSNEDFQERYKKQLKLATVELNLAHVALGYSLATYLNACAEYLVSKGLDYSTDNILTAIRSLTHEDLMGRVEFKNGRSVNREQTLFTAKNGKLVLVDEDF